jgi:nucleotide-binding universal stress UspA family protein
MRPFRKIFVPTDFSPPAAEAFRHAVALAGPLGATVVLCHVARAPAVVVNGGQLLANEDGGGPKDLWADFQSSAPDDGGPPIEHQVIVADRPSASHIVDILETTGCDLIVMGTHELSGIKHRLFGGLTEEVVRAAHCPVMVVKEPVASSSDRHTGPARHSSSAEPKAFPKEPTNQEPIR